MKKLIALTLAIMLVPPVGMYSHYVSLNPDSSNSGADTSKPTSKTSPSSTPSSDSRVLGATNEDGNDSNQIYFTVNIPSTFKEDISAPNIVYSVNGENGDIEIETRLVAGDGILVQGRTINNTGILTLVAGTGITVSDNIITNDGIVSLTAGTGIEIDGSEITNTYTFTPDYTQSGWTDNGSSVVLTTTSDSVTVGTLTTGAITASSITVDGLSVLSGNATIGNGVAVLPSVDLGSDLGSTSLRFNNLWVANINSNSSQSFSGQTTFSYPPTDTTLDEASVLINPTTSAASGQLLGLAIAGYQKAMIDEDGDITLGYQDQTSAPASDDPLNIYGHNGTRVSFVDTTGNAYFAGRVGIGTSSPAEKLHVYGGASGGTPVPAAEAIIEDYGDSILQFLSKGTWYSNIIYFGDDVDSDIGAIQYNHTTDKMHFRASNANVLTIDGPSGHIGIGTTSPGAKLHIVGTEDDQQFIIQGNGTQTANIFEWQNSSGTVLGGVDERGILFSDGNTAATNVFIGNDSGNNTASGVNNVGIGDGALEDLTTGAGNHAIGRDALKDVTSGVYNIAIGTYAGFAITTSPRNIGIGANSLFTMTTNTGGDNVAIGYTSFNLATSALYNTGLGNYVGDSLTTGDSNIFLGYKSGSRQTTNSNLLIIDNQERADTATELTNSIIYGVMDATATNQSLRVNGEFQVMSGNVGIGTTSPGAKLDISESYTSGIFEALRLKNTYGSGTAQTGVSTTFYHYDLTNPSAKIEMEEIDISDFRANLKFFVRGINSDSLPSEVMRLQYDGNIGIGTTSPTSKLEIDGLALTDTNSAFRIAGGFGDGEYIDIGGLRKIGVSDAGNLFMGYNFGYDATNNSYEYDGSDEASGMEFTTAGEIKFLTASLGTAGDDFTPTARMTIDNNGNVGIGTTSLTAKLSIVGTTSDPVFSVYDGVYTTNLGFGTRSVGTERLSLYKNSYATVIDSYSTNQSALSSFSFQINGSTKMVLDNSGNIGIGTTEPGEKLEVTGNIKTSSLASNGAVYSNSGVLTNTDPSDRNLKHNILTLEDGTLDKVLGLRPVSFNWNSTGDGGLSFIAQEVNEIFPELVGSNSDGTLGLYTTQFIPVLAKAIQEQQLEIDEIALSTASADLSAYATLADTNILQDIIDDFKAQLANSVTSITGYFDEVFANKSHQKELCIGEFDDETCLSKNQVDQLIQLLPSATPEPEATTPEATPDPSGTPSPEPSASPTPSPETEAGDVPGATGSATP